jgi:hypothetical protein
MKAKVAYADQCLGAFSRTLPPDLVLTDRLLQRWAVSIGDGLPSESWDDVPGAKPPPLDDETAVLVDKIVLKSPEDKRQFVRKWYKTNEPREVIAKALHLPRRGMNLVWFSVLEYLRGQFLQAGLEVGP